MLTFRERYNLFLCYNRLTGNSYEDAKTQASAQCISVRVLVFNTLLAHRELSEKQHQHLCTTVSDADFSNAMSYYLKQGTTPKKLGGRSPKKRPRNSNYDGSDDNDFTNNHFSEPRSGHGGQSPYKYKPDPPMHGPPGAMPFQSDANDPQPLNPSMDTRADFSRRNTGRVQVQRDESMKRGGTPLESVFGEDKQALENVLVQIQQTARDGRVPTEGERARWADALSFHCESIAELKSSLDRLVSPANDTYRSETGFRPEKFLESTYRMVQYHKQRIEGECGRLTRGVVTDILDDGQTFCSRALSARNSFDGRGIVASVMKEAAEKKIISVQRKKALITSQLARCLCRRKKALATSSIPASRRSLLPGSLRTIFQAISSLSRPVKLLTI